MVSDLDLLRRPISDRLSMYPGLKGVVVSDKDGVAVLQVAKEGHGRKIDSLMRYTYCY